MTDKSKQDILNDIIACDTDIVVRAGAGSGKTYALVEKYLDEIQKKRDGAYTTIDRLVALTFTEKAAAEMKKRVRDGLTKLIENLRDEIEQNESPGLTGSSANLPEEPFEMSEKKKLALSLIQKRQALEGAYISTIHSFCARILRENPLSAGVDPGFTVMGEEESSTLLDNAARKVIMERLRLGDAAVASLIKDEKFETGGPWYPGLKGHITRLIPLMRAASFGPMKMLSEYNAILKKAEEQSKNAREKLSLVLPKLAEAKYPKEKSVAKELEIMPGLFDSKPIELSDSINLLKLAKGLEDAVKKRKTRSDEDNAPALLAANLMRSISSPALERMVAPNTRALIGLLDSALKEYSKEKVKRSSLDYDDLEEKMLHLLRDNQTVRKVYSQRFIRVLVDEFQDINNLQCEIISQLSPPGEGKLFIVGDFKQSIYGFRGADVEVFEQMAEAITSSGGKGFALQTNRRSTPGLIDFTNDFFEQVMSGADGAFRFDRSIDGLEATRDSAGVSCSVERITYGTGVEKTDELRMIEAKILAANIREEVKSGKIQVKGEESIRPINYGDIAILLRTFSKLNVYENALRRSSIPFSVVRGRGFYHSPEIMDFINLLSFLDYSADKLGLISILRSPLAGLSDAALFTLCRFSGGTRADDPAPFIFNDTPLPKGLSKDDKNKITTFRKRVREWRYFKDRMTISELLETILSESGYGAVMMGRSLGEQKLANLFKLIELARAYETNGAFGLKNFVSLLKKHKEQAPREAQADVTGGDDNTVKIMTVHQSKGLEFPVVILADIGGSDNNDTSSVAFHPRVGAGIKYTDHSLGEKAEGLMFSKAKQERNKGETEEVKRLLYVGMTRARDRLILSGGGCDKAKGKWSKWINETLAKAGSEVTLLHFEAAKEIVEGQGAVTAPNIVERILKGESPKPDKVTRKLKELRKPEFMMPVTGLATLRQCPRMYYYHSVMELSAVGACADFSKKQEKEHSASKLGSQVHAMLEKIPLGKQAQGSPIAKLTADELSEYPKKLVEEVNKNIKRTFAAKPLCDLSDIKSELIFRETPLLCKISEKGITVTLTGAADLLWQNEKSLHLVDYKYSKKPHDELRYVFQLKLYAYILMTAMDDVDIVEASIVYLKERKDSASSMRILRSDMRDIRKQIVDCAKHLENLSGKPENIWPIKDKNFCDDLLCAFKGRCHQRKG